MTEKRTYIYALTDNNGVRYIGKTDNIERRFKNHFYEAFDKNGICYYLPKSRWIRKRTDEISYKILETCDTSEWANKEKEWIKLYREGNTNLLNLSDGGHGGSGPKSEITRQKLRLKALGRKASEETKKKMSEIHKKIDIYWLNEHHDGKSNPRARAVLQYDLEDNFIKEWDTIKEAANFYNRSNITLCGHLSGKNKTFAGYKFKYKYYEG